MKGYTEWRDFISVTVTPVVYSTAKLEKLLQVLEVPQKYTTIFLCGKDYRDHFNKLAGAFTPLGSLLILSKLLMSNKQDHQTTVKRSGIC